MDIISNGSKPVVYKSIIYLNFNSAAIEDKRVTVTHIFTKFMEDGVAVAFGECNIFLLFSYLDNKKHKVYLTQTQVIRFSEAISCNLSEMANDNYSTQYFDVHTSFNPRVSCIRGAGNAWNVGVEGEFDVIVYGEKAEFEPHVTSDKYGSQNWSDSAATVMRLDHTDITAKELLDMDIDSIKKLSGMDDAPSVPDTSKQ